ncbi:sugar ABC transporter ATPase [Paraburkholderia sp. CNPSo 3281]|uniref:sugar ABC transporter ATPase n=1 Tax=Paraburkholderia sp. CNPSo 3281 TaxID=2940933 RepID=UPI0020B86C70|nr:sugar ABC transporter ATPase [Paraburkholderia sp. CNPSo 3281]MCP3720465.1 sugar ABC transporter ATPase [Paraburkholderia sp. CNPSo 3281]
MKSRFVPTIAVVFGGVISCAVAHAAGSQDDSPCSAESAAHAGSSYPQFFLPDQNGKPVKPSSSVRTFTTRDCAGAVLQGEHASAQVQGDAVELRDGKVYVNDLSYGAVTREQSVEYDVRQDKRTLLVDGKVRTPAH